MAMSSGWYEREQSESDWWQWTSGRGLITITVDREMDTVLRGEIRSLHVPNRVDVILNGSKIATYNIGTSENRPFEPLALHLNPGKNTLEFASYNPGTPTETDTRQLAVLVRNLTASIGQRCRLVVGSWYATEWNGADWWRWTDKRGQVLITADAEGDAVLRGRILSHQVPNKVDVLVNDQKVGVIDFTSRAWISLGSLRIHLQAGENLIEFVSQDAPSTTATDSRLLAVAVRNLTVATASEFCACQ